MLGNDPPANTSQQFVLIALILTLVTLFLELDQLNFNEELLHEEEKIVSCCILSTSYLIVLNRHRVLSQEIFGRSTSLCTQTIRMKIWRNKIF